jgi:phage terminase small subunit
MATRGLMPRQQNFVREILIDGNATAAYKRSGYKVKNDRVAQAAAARLLTNPDISAAIAEQRAARNARVLETGDNVPRELMVMAYSDIGDILDFRGDEITLRRASEISARALKTIERIKLKRRLEGNGPSVVEVIEVKLWNKVWALGKLFKHLGLDGRKKSPPPTPTVNEHSTEDKLAPYKSFLADLLAGRLGCGENSGVHTNGSGQPVHLPEAAGEAGEIPTPDSHGERRAPVSGMVA